MMKRVVALLLCLVMTFGILVPNVSAAGGSGYSTDDLYFGEGQDVTYHDDGSITVKPSAEEKTSELAPVIPEEEPEPPKEMGQATAVVEDATVDAQGVPENSSLKVQEAKAEADKIIDEMASAREHTGEQLFRYDISVEDAAGMEWQPNGKVRMELTIPSGQKLHKRQQVYVVHVSDDGKANYIDAQVSDAGTIIFEIDSFSTFAGFTVAFPTMERSSPWAAWKLCCCRRCSIS